MSIDDFRDAGSFMDEDDEPEPRTTSTRRRGGSGGPSGGALGITPLQRFILSLLLLMMACLLGAFCLIATGRVIPPGLY